MNLVQEIPCISSFEMEADIIVKETLNEIICLNGLKKKMVNFLEASGIIIDSGDLIPSDMSFCPKIMPSLLREDLS